MRTVTSSSSKTAVGVGTEGLQRCKGSILQRVLGERNRDSIAAGDGSKADREAASWSDDETPRERAEGLMKHVPNGREERKTAKDGTQVPMKNNSQGRDR